MTRESVDRGDTTTRERWKLETRSIDGFISSRCEERLDCHQIFYIKPWFSDTAGLIQSRSKMSELSKRDFGSRFSYMMTVWGVADDFTK